MISGRFPRFEEQYVILLCGQVVARVFHRDVAGRLTQMLPEGRRLADLASAYHQHHFALFEHTANRWLYFAFYIHEMASLPRGHVLTLRQFGQIWELCSQILLPLDTSSWLSLDFAAPFGQVRALLIRLSNCLRACMEESWKNRDAGSQDGETRPFPAQNTFDTAATASFLASRLTCV